MDDRAREMMMERPAADFEKRIPAASFGYG